MAYTPIPLVTTGDDWSAANHNTYVKDNMATTMPATIDATGDMVYASGSNVLAKLPLTPYAIMYGDTDTPAWLETEGAWHQLSTNSTSDGITFGALPFIGEVCSSTSTVSIAPSGDNPVSFTQAMVDEYSMWSATDATKIYIPASFPSGKWYRIEGYLNCYVGSTTSSETFRQVALGINGAVTEGISYSSGYYNKIFHMSFSCVRELDPDDYVELLLRHYNSGNMYVYDAQLSVIMLR